MVSKMKKSIFKTAFLFLLIFFCIYFFSPAKIYSQTNNTDYSPDEIVVSYRSDVSIPLEERQKYHRSVNGEMVGKIERLGVEVIKVKDIDVDKASEILRRSPNVNYAEPNYKAYAYEITNDPGILEKWQWGMYKTQAASSGESAWNLSKGNAGIKVAVLDTGIDSSHEDLAGKVSAVRNCTNSAKAEDFNGHGTHVAGIIAATSNNSKGVSGIGYNISLINAKVLGDDGSGYYSWIADCMVWATDQGAKVINLSLGGSQGAKVLEDAVNYAYKKGVVIVAAAGNEGSSNPSYPAYYANVLSVAATDSSDNKPGWSNWGNWVDVAAPGVSVYSTLPSYSNAQKKLNYGTLSGTSMAAPHVAGLAGLIFAKSDGIDNTRVISAIEENADKISGTGSSWKYGRINAYHSLSALFVGQIPAPSPTYTPTPTFTPTPTITPTPTVVVIPTSTLTPVPNSSKFPSIQKPPVFDICKRLPYLCRQKATRG